MVDDFPQKHELVDVERRGRLLEASHKCLGRADVEAARRRSSARRDRRPRGRRASQVLDRRHVLEHFLGVVVVLKAPLLVALDRLRGNRPLGRSGPVFAEILRGARRKAP